MYVSDLHNDFISTGQPFALVERDINENCRKAVFAVYKGDKTLEQVIECAERIRNLNNPKILTAFEDADLIDEQNFHVFKSFNPVYVTLTWNHENSLGFGCAHNKGLKDKGRKIIGLLNDAGIAADTAHLSEKGFYEAAELSGIIINSHTCFSAVHRHRRNISKKQIKTIIEKNGIIGLTFVSDFLCGSGLCRIEHVLRHICWFIDNFGDGHLCLGTDFYGTDSLPSGLTNYRDATILACSLIRYGYTYQTVENIFYNNFEKFLHGRIND